MTGWYSKFISDYSDIAAPIEAFSKRINAMCQAHVLHSPDCIARLFIHCNASNASNASSWFKIRKETKGTSIRLPLPQRNRVKPKKLLRR